MGTFLSLILNLKYSDLPGLLDHSFVNGCSRRSKKKKKSYLRYLKKNKKTFFLSIYLQSCGFYRINHIYILLVNLTSYI